MRQFETSNLLEIDSHPQKIPITKRKWFKITSILSIILILAIVIILILDFAGIISIFTPSNKQQTVKLANGITVTFTEDALKSLFTPKPYNATIVNYTEQQSARASLTDPEAEAEASCSQNGFCSSCTTHLSGIFSCRWCPITAQCHAWGSIYNPCSSSQQITDRNKCPTDSYIDPVNNIRLTNYDEDISIKMIQYSYLAYMDELNNPNHDPDDNDIPIPETLELVANYSYRMNHDDDETFVFIGCDNENKHIIISFRGSSSAIQLFYEFLDRHLAAWNLMDLDGIDIKDSFGIHFDVKVVSYFMSGYSGLSERIYDTLKQILNDPVYSDYDVWWTGHSLGGALTSIGALHIWLQSQYIDNFEWKPFLIYTYGEPRIGNPGFSNLFDAIFEYTEPHNYNAYRIVNDDDIIPHILACDWDNTIWQRCLENNNAYYHKGIEIHYGAGDYKYGRMCQYRECLGTPKNEDAGCSNRYITFSVGPHSGYKPVFQSGGFCQNQ